jgi:hypothetical protein
MKIIFSISVLLCMLYAPLLEAQVRVLSENIEFNGKIGVSQRKSLIIQNESNTHKEYILKSLRGNVGSSQSVKICVGEQCFDSKKDLSKIKIHLGAGEVFTDLYLEFFLGNTETKGSFELYFVNSGNARDSFTIESLYHVYGTGTSKEELENVHKDITMSPVYPNPSQRIANIDYVIKNPAAKAKISINSFIGNPVTEYILDPNQKTLTINVGDFNPGVYFYTLFVDNKNIVTKKLVVKK